MSEQTANLCTTDACESLRARLAKYEDAEGNPICGQAVAWQFQDKDGKWYTGLETNDHRANTEQAGYPTRDLCVSSSPSHGEQVRDGWQLVPVKPTIDMVEAGYEASLGQPDRSKHACVIEQYDAMLAAAPSAASQEQGE